MVALEHKVLVYNFADLRLLHSIETLSNPAGLLALSPVSDQTVLACPGINVGQVRCLRTNLLRDQVPCQIQVTIVNCPMHLHIQLQLCRGES